MQAYQIALIVAAGVVALFCVLLLLMAAAIERTVFSKRYDKNPRLKYFTAEDFYLSAKEVALNSGLKGFLYTAKKEQNGKLVIFCHGLGEGQIAYTTEIAFFCNNGYTVLAIDSTGCNFSAGKSIRGFYEGVKTAVSAVDYARTLDFEKLYLIGHSWGAYSALCASKKRKVDGVVAISAPITPVGMIVSAASGKLSKPIARLLTPFVYLVKFFKFGFNCNMSAQKSAETNETKTLLIQGDKDNLVKLKNSVFYKANGKNIEKLLAEGKAHNPYNTLNAERMLGNLLLKLNSGEDTSNFDFAAATEEDEEVMQKILMFLDK